MIRNIAKRIYMRLRRMAAARQGSAAYWTVHMVAHESFQTAEESLSHFHWRNAQYPGYIELMPVTGQDGKVIMDYGCGPGNDIVGFSEYSNPSKLYGVDVSRPALDLAEKRLSLHKTMAEFIWTDEKSNEIPLPSESIDYIHSSGVLHHCANLEAVLMEFYRLLKPEGAIAVMIYNYHSIWVHLYVAYIRKIKNGDFHGKDLLDAFRCSTDGAECPVSRCYRSSEFLEIFRAAGFRGEFKGASISLTELKALPERYDAISDKRLPMDQRNFLSSLTFDERGIPSHSGKVAGINGCYLFYKEKE